MQEEEGGWDRGGETRRLTWLGWLSGNSGCVREQPMGLADPAGCREGGTPLQQLARHPVCFSAR